jgi:hypothetical protein
LERAGRELQEILDSAMNNEIWGPVFKTCKAKQKLIK